MRQIWTVFLYTLKDAVRKKAFKISTILLMVVVLGGCLILKFTGSDSGDELEKAPEAAVQEETQEEVALEGRCYYIDVQNAIPGGMQALQEEMPEIAFEQGDVSKTEAYHQEIAEDAELSMILIVPAEKANEPPTVSVMTKDFMSGVSGNQAGDVLTRQYIANQLQEQGIKSESVEALLNVQLPVTSGIAGEMDLSGYILGIVITMLIFFAIYYYGYGVSMSIATEKTSRVMETLVVSAKPSRILVGKCLAMGVLGLLQFGGIIAFAAICYHYLVPADYLIMGMPMSLSCFTLERAIIILTYFVLGYTLYAVMNAVCGASVSKIEDLNSAMMPVMLIAMISFYIGYFAAISGSGADSMLQKVAIYIPFCSPFIVPFKILNGDVPAMDILLSIAALLVAIVAIAAVSIRIYTASVLHYGNRLKLKDMFRMKV